MIANMATKISTRVQIVVGDVIAPKTTLKGVIINKHLVFIFLLRNFKLD